MEEKNKKTAFYLFYRHLQNQYFFQLQSQLGQSYYNVLVKKFLVVENIDIDENVED